MADPADVLPESEVERDKECGHPDGLCSSCQRPGGGLCDSGHRVRLSSTDLLPHNPSKDVTVQALLGLRWTATLCR